MHCRRVSALLLVWSCGVALSSPVPALRVRRDATALPGGIPLEVLFSACGADASSADIGPCVQQLVQSAIELARPQFSTGIVIQGKTKVLDPLALKDIPAKPGRKFTFALSDLKVHGLSTVNIEDVRLEPTVLAVEASFAQLRATSDMTLRYTFIRGDTEVEITLQQPRVRVQAGWQLDASGGKLGIRLTDPQVDVQISDLSTRITRLGGLGGFLERIINQNSQVLLEILVPELERQAQQKIAEELGTVKLA